MIPLRLVGVRVELESNQPIVLLREASGTRYLPIFIGSPEATAIVYAMQGLDTPRPMTHDLMKQVLDDRNIVLRRVDITALEARTFFAELHLDADGELRKMDSRPSDAIALAVRYGTDVVELFASEAVLDEAGVELPDEDDDPEAQVEEFREFLDSINPEDFA